MTKPEKPAPKPSHTGILFGPPGLADDAHTNSHRSYAAARLGITELFFAAWDGRDQQACDRLVILGTIICSRLEQMWRKASHRALIENAGLKVSSFPVLHTNAEAGTIDTRSAEEIRQKIVLWPGRKKGRRGPKIGDDPLNRELERFVKGVTEPGWLRTTEGRDIVSADTRRRLRGATDADWAEAFAEQYIRPYRPDLMAADGNSGAFAHMATVKQRRRQKRNANEKSVWRALKEIVSGRMPKFRGLIDAK